MWTVMTDQTRRMPRVIRVFAGGTVILLVLSSGSSYILLFGCFSRAYVNVVPTDQQSSEYHMILSQCHKPVSIRHKTPFFLSIIWSLHMQWSGNSQPTHLNPFVPRHWTSLYTGRVYFQCKGRLVYFFIFVVFFIEIPVSKQCRSCSDAAFCCVWSGSTLFV